MAHAQPDFELKITPTEVELLNSPVGSGLRTAFKLPFTPDDLQDISLDLAAQVTSNSNSYHLVHHQVGKRLFDSLFADQNLRWLYEHSHTSEEGLRLKLHLDEALACYPWELLHHAHEHASIYKLSVVRYQSSPIKSQPLVLSGPLRLLVAAGYSSSQQLEEKIEQLHVSLAPLEKNGLLQLVILKKASLSVIHQSLTDDPFHVLHYLGDCLVTASNQPSKLRFWNHGLHHDCWVEPLRLWRILSQTGTIRLLWLNSFGKMNSTLALQEAARSLVEAGLPAVIANRLHINGQMAALLSGAFYKRLANGLPVDQALTMACHQICESSSHRHQCTCPMLFTHTQNGVLFTKPQATFSQKRILTMLESEQGEVSLTIPTLPLKLSPSALYNQASFLEKASSGREYTTTFQPIEQDGDSEQKREHYFAPWSKQTLKFLRTVLNLIAILLTLFLFLPS